MTEPAPTLPTPRQPEHARYDALLDERERAITDGAVAVELLFDIVQADTDQDRDLVMRRVKRFLLVET